MPLTGVQGNESEDNFHGCNIELALICLFLCLKWFTKDLVCVQLPKGKLKKSSVRKEKPTEPKGQKQCEFNV